MHFVGVVYFSGNSQSMIVRPGQNFNSHSLEIYFFKNCDAHFISDKGCFRKIFGNYAREPKN